MIVGRNIDDNCTTEFYEMTSDNVRANFSIQRKLLSVFKKRFEAEVHYSFTRKAFITDHAFYKVIALLSATLS